MRPARPLVVAVAFAMAVLAGTEQVASALGQQAAGSAGATDAAAKGGRDGALTSRGQLPAEQADSVTRLPSTAKTPKPGPVRKVAGPVAPEPVNFRAGDGFETSSTEAQIEFGADRGAGSPRRAAAGRFP